MSNSKIDYERRFLLQVILPLTILFPATLVAFFVMGHGWAYLVGQGGALAVFIANLLWIVLVDSKRRWPGVKAFNRYARVVTFYRD